ncbi:cobalamin B12-binding domain-containing protein [Hungatella hominis]|uniref:Cobalamin B12-binding domain-containing protein n=1 Tax=Hungatella hominis TaxID=2763050 RepID=A0ABR7H9P3_9FIRM|nr:cobalamin-dependent protein [Hungatella hominis]MBC5709878.1 cobalamin B12-binding domain-containing protein [Hungatella hominis]
MSLLMMDQSPEFQRLTNEVYTRQLERDPRLSEVLDNRARQRMYQDVQYNIDFLYTAMQLEDDGIFEKYAKWVYQLLCPLMAYCTRERVKDIMVDHYEMIRSCMATAIPVEKLPKLHRLLDSAVQATKEEYEQNSPAESFSLKYEKEISKYLDCLLRSDTKGAINLVGEFIKTGIPVGDICVDIITETMRRVGDLWHSHQISVDMEHYCTSITQMALSQLYPVIFDQERNGKTVVVACVGSELHEMGARMVADLFEYAGWDSIYLGAAVPAEAIESSVMEHQPRVVALSVTMPQHLPLCKEVVDRLRCVSPETRIAVGGNAFLNTEIWKNWGVDQHTKDARALVEWADGIL